MMTIFGELCE